MPDWRFHLSAVRFRFCIPNFGPSKRRCSCHGLQTNTEFCVILLSSLVRLSTHKHTEQILVHVSISARRFYGLGFLIPSAGAPQKLGRLPAVENRSATPLRQQRRRLRRRDAAIKADIAPTLPWVLGHSRHRYHGAGRVLRRKQPR